MDESLELPETRVECWQKRVFYWLESREELQQKPRASVTVEHYWHTYAHASSTLPPLVPNVLRADGRALEDQIITWSASTNRIMQRVHYNPQKQ